MELSQADIDYFKRGAFENPMFWSRLGGKPPLKGANVLDVGCGLGSLCVDIALSGAKKVVGIDINPQLIDFAKENLRQNYQHLLTKVEFKDIELREYPEFTFDYIVSKDTFEHIFDLEMVINEIKKRLKPKGRVYAGFGPLYHSSFGDHGRTKTLIPYGHLLIPESIIISRLNRQRVDKINSIQDLGLNKMSLSDYKRVLRHSGLRIVYFRINQGNHVLLGLSSLISRIQFLEEYFSHNLYCILEKSSD